MNSKLIIAVLVGLVASTCALDLSHADPKFLQANPRLFSFLNDFYAQVVYPPLNHVVTNLALLGAQVLAGISQNGIPAPNGRTLHPSEAELRGFFDDLWNNALRPPIENALSGLSLLAAQLLAGIGTDGINLSIGKRDMTEAEMRGFFDDLWNDALRPPIENALSGLSLLAAQLLAGIGTNGVNLSIGKRDMTEAEMRGFFDDLTQAFNTVFTQVIQKPLEDALSGGALMLAQVLAGLGTNGINLGSLVGKRDLSSLAGHQEELRGFFDTLGQNLLNGLQSVWTNIIQNPLEQALQSGALMAAQVLAGLGTNGVNLSNIGKRELDAAARGPIIDNLVSHANDLLANQVKPVVENALNAAALHLASVLANFAQSGIGRR